MSSQENTVVLHYGVGHLVTSAHGNSFLCQVSFLFHMDGAVPLYHGCGHAHPRAAGVDSNHLAMTTKGRGVLLIQLLVCISSVSISMQSDSAVIAPVANRMDA